MSTQSSPAQQTIPSLFMAHEKKNQRHAKIFYEDMSLSFSELDQVSNSATRFLLSKHIKSEDLVCVLMTRSIEAIAGQLGILKAGGAYLPISPDDFPEERIRTIFDDAQVKFVVTLREHQHLVNKLQKKRGHKFSCFYLDEKRDDKAELTDWKDKATLIPSQPVKPDNLAYVMYTSGSTGKPKGVMVTHKNIISSVKDTDYVNFGKNDAILHAAPISFDAATFEIWAALLNDLDLYIVPEAVVHDFKAFSDYVRNRPISIVWLTSALFNLLADSRPDFFEYLRQLMVGGEALSPKHINLIRSRYPHLKIRNNYGPTENTVFSSSFLIEKNYENNIPIGHAINKKRAYILNENMEIAAPNTKGILYVAGEGLARGYLNLPKETLNTFIPDPFVKGEKMYDTGDLCRYNINGEIEFIGRMDDQVKISGHRIELGEIEAAICTCPQVKQAIVLYKHLGVKIKGLAAYIVPNLEKTHTNHDLGSIKAYLADKLPQYMIPSYFETLESFPITTNGKIDRKVINAWPLKSKNTATHHKQNIEKTVLSSCKHLLNLTEIKAEDCFFDLGGDSLLGTSLIINLEQVLGIVLPLQTLYENPIILDFINCIKAISNSNEKPPHKKYLQEQHSQTLAQDAALDFDIHLNEQIPSVVSDMSEESSNIFLTGATGFFGAFLLKELLKTTKAMIHCLVRANDIVHAYTRILDTLKKYKISISSTEANRIIGIPGDLAQSNLGLSEAKFTTLAQTMDMIFHSGAAVNYVDPYSKLKPTNVFGTHEIIRLSCHQIPFHKNSIPIHYISSISVFETLGFFTGRDVVFENESVDISESYVRLGYSQSKWVAEKLMENARAKGLPINIYRSAYIMGYSETGVSNTTDHIARYIAGCIEMGCAPILNECASLTPVDQVSRALCHIALHAKYQQKTQGQTYHLCNPTFISVTEIYQQIQNFGFPLKLITYDEWKEQLKTIPNTNPLYPLLSLHIHSAPNHDLTLPELYERNTRFDCTNLLNALAGSGIQLGLNNTEVFERWLNNYVEAGLISEQSFQQALDSTDKSQSIKPIKSSLQGVNACKA